MEDQMEQNIDSSVLCDFNLISPSEINPNGAENECSN